MITPEHFEKQYQGQHVPTHIQDGIIRYINEGVPTGSFLQFVISNDLRGAVGQADDMNRANLFAIVSWFHGEAPRMCWGSPSRYRLWIEAHQAARDGVDLNRVGGGDDEARAVFDQVRAVIKMRAAQTQTENT